MSEGRNPRLIGIFCLAIVCFLSSGQSLKIDSNPRIKNYSPQEISFIKSLVDKISENELRDDVVALQDQGTRYAPSQGNLRAANYIKQSFLSAGFKDAAFDEFSYYSDQTETYEITRNVIASKPGVKTPEKIVIIGAHFDTITRSAQDGRVSSLNRENPSPGADDNATGVAAVLAAARLLNSYEFDCTLRFIAFSAEEGGIFGSAHYAARSARENEDIVAMINLDMLGYVKQDPEDIDIFANRKSAWLLDRITNSAPIYAPDLLIYRIIDDRYDGSDQGPFWNNGYPGVCFMEDYYPSSRLYHTPKDTVDSLNFPFFLNCTRLAVANLAELAGIRIKSGQRETSGFSGQYKGVNWQQDSGKKWLFTVSPYLNQANIIDVSLPRISSNTSLSLGDIPPETWGQPRYYPVAACQKPGSRLIYVSLIRQRAPGKERERGMVEIVDPGKTAIVDRFEVGNYPTTGCFNASGARYYQSYWGERFIDIFDTRSLKSIDRITTLLPLSKLAVDDEEKWAVGISTETNSAIIINLIGKSIDKVINDISAPKDILMVSDGLALVCSYDQARVYQIDTIRKEVSEGVETGLRPVRLIISPQKDLIVILHQLGTQIDPFHVARSNGHLTLERRKTLDLGEVIADGTFAGDDMCYFVSSSKSRIFGMNLSSEKTFWAMRTGGVRARGDVERIIFIRE